MKEIIQSHLPFSEESFELLLSIATEKKAKKNELLFSPDLATNKILFLKKGLLRGYKLIDGKDYTHHFYHSNWFATDYYSYLTEKPGQLFITSLEDTVYLEFQKDDLLDLYEKSNEIGALGRIIAEKAFLLTVEKFSNIQLHSLIEKYENLIKTSPDLIHKVPQKYIASYLGVSEQSLSRIKAQVIS